MTPLQEHLILPHLLSTGGLFQRKLWVGRSNWTGWTWRKHVLKRMASFKILFNNKQEAHLKFPPCPPAWNSLATQGGSSQDRGQIHPWSTASARRQGSPPRTWFSAQIKIPPNNSPKNLRTALSPTVVVVSAGCLVNWRDSTSTAVPSINVNHIFSLHLPNLFYSRLRPFLFRVQKNHMRDHWISVGSRRVGGRLSTGGRGEQCVRRDRLGILPKPLLLLHNPRDRPRF